MINSNCPYCKSPNKSDITITKNFTSNVEVTCSNCEYKYNIDVSLNVIPFCLVEELEKIIPKDTIKEVVEAIKKYLGGISHGGYYKNINVTIDKKIDETFNVYDGQYDITIYAKGASYIDDYRRITFSVLPSGEVKYNVNNYTQKFWFIGETLEERVSNYIKKAFVEWELI